MNKHQQKRSQQLETLYEFPSLQFLTSLVFILDIFQSHGAVLPYLHSTVYNLAFSKQVYSVLGLNLK